MLTLTDEARLAIQSLTAPVESAPGAGVRIAANAPADGQGQELALTVATDPQPGDQVVDDAGARVFLDPTAAQILDEQTLDVQVDTAAQQVNFFLA